ncbi:hypothetical protein LshimejAT787_0306040 [Lyophyllum shimeji]|uniref:Uncharacterized protein n=1 Tax=Lyophyllum shimeji TaxID=47721 RepID=A0A9P3PJ24_LYOSH|nr:hypothetical protein LshimejAT787_0306040 [Lyophyllum shimeji]
MSLLERRTGHSRFNSRVPTLSFRGDKLLGRSPQSLLWFPVSPHSNTSLILSLSSPSKLTIGPFVSLGLAQCVPAR